MSRVNDPWPLKLLTSIRMCFGTAIVFSALVMVFAVCADERNERKRECNFWYMALNICRCGKRERVDKRRVEEAKMSPILRNRKRDRKKERERRRQIKRMNESDIKREGRGQAAKSKWKRNRI